MTFENPYWIPGWTVQNPTWVQLPDPPSPPAVPSDLKVVIVQGNYVDFDGQPLGGSLTFIPSEPVEDIASKTIIMPRQIVSYLEAGQMLVNLVATDDTHVTPTNFVYHVVERFPGGRRYDINVPSASADNVDINSLIVPGSLAT